MLEIWKRSELIKAERCVFCGSGEFVNVAVRSDGLSLQECKPCGLAFVDPRPSSTQLSEYYSSGYFSGEKDFFRGKDYCEERDRAIAAEEVTGYSDLVSN